MARGGKREGAGRKKGAKAKFTEAALSAAGEGILPLEFMLNVMRDETADFAQRFDAAKSAAPYVHPRLAQIESNVTHRKAADELSEAELASYLTAGSSAGIAEPKAGAPKPH